MASVTSPCSTRSRWVAASPPIDVDESKLALATKHGAEVVVNAATEADPAGRLQELTGGVHGALVTAVNAHAFPQAVGALRRGGTVSLVGLPPDQFPLDIFTTVLFGLTVRGSIVGTRKDMTEALDFYARGLIHPTYTLRPLERHQRDLRRDARGRDRRSDRHGHARLRPIEDGRWRPRRYHRPRVRHVRDDVDG